MTIFDTQERTFLGPKSRTEGDFEYLNRSARPEAAQVRAFVDEWVGRFPSEHRQEVVSRLRDRDGPNCSSASFELILYASAVSLGYEVEIHPELPNGSAKRPDFLLTRKGEPPFYLEAVLASEFDVNEVAARKRKSVVLEALEGLDSPNFFIGVNPEGAPGTPPSAKALKRDLGNWLSTLSPDEVMEQFEQSGGSALPKFKWVHEGWKVTFEAIPKSPQARGKGQRVIGVEFGGARWVSSWVPVRDAIRSKGTRYGELDKAMVIAVNADCISFDRIDETQALFGAETFVFSRNEPGSSPIMRREPNGAWYGQSGPVFTRVSAAWLVHSVNLWNVATRKTTLYFNPWATKALPAGLTALRHARVENEKLRWSDGQTFAEILGLPGGWPIEQPET